MRELFPRIRKLARQQKKELFFVAISLSNKKKIAVCQKKGDKKITTG
jgi:hypothetical protein